MKYAVKALPPGEDFDTSDADYITIDTFEAPHQTAADKIVAKSIKEGKYPFYAGADEMSE